MSGQEQRLTSIELDRPCSRDFCTNVATVIALTSRGWLAACDDHRDFLLAWPPASPAVTHQQPE